MKKILARIIHFISPKYFSGLSYYELEKKWGIVDIYDGKLSFDHEELYFNDQTYDYSQNQSKKA